MNRYLLLILLLTSFQAFSQTTYEIRGLITDTLNVPLAGSGVKLLTSTDTIATSANENGEFSFKNIETTRFKLTVSLLGFQTYSHDFNLSPPSKQFNLPKISLKVQSNVLDEVTIIGINPIVVKEDTIQYNASAFPVREGAPVEDMVKKLPGVTVDKDGNITAQGKQIARVRVNGKDFFGGDVQTATQNLPADIIENLQIIDDYGDQANLTGIKSGDPEKILNITIQKGKRKGYFGNGTAGGGTDERYVGRAIGNNFNEEQQVSFLGSINNTNANTFNFNGGGKGGGSRGADLGGNERGNNPDGITLSKSLGGNFRDKWGKKLSVYGSYSFSGRDNNTLTNSLQRDYNPNNNIITSRNSNTDTFSGNHRFTWNTEYAADSSNFFKFTPYFSLSSSNNDNTGTSNISRRNYYTLSNSASQNSTESPGYGADLTYNHRFNKRGRNTNISIGFDYLERDQGRDLQNNYLNIDSNLSTPVQTSAKQYQHVVNNAINNRNNAKLSYVEPLAKTLFIEFNYARNSSETTSLKDVNNVNPTTGVQRFNARQSNNYEYQFVTNRYGINIRSVKPKYNYTLGLIAQPSSLTGQDLSRNVSSGTHNFNFVPNARVVYNFEKNNSLIMNYGGSSREPRFSQIQPVRDSSHIKNIIVGNPNLQAEFVNRLSLQYNKFKTLSGNSLFANIAFDQTKNKIVNSRVNDSVGTGRTTTFLNTNGFYGLNSNISFSKPFSDRKYTVSIAGSINYDNNLSFVDNQKNHGQNWFIRPLAGFKADFEDIIDAELKVSYAMNRATTRYADYSNTTQANTFTFGINGRSYFLKDWTLGYDFTKLFRGC